MGETRTHIILAPDQATSKTIGLPLVISMNFVTPAGFEPATPTLDAILRLALRFRYLGRVTLTIGRYGAVRFGGPFLIKCCALPAELQGLPFCGDDRIRTYNRRLNGPLLSTIIATSPYLRYIRDSNPWTPP